MQNLLKLLIKYGAFFLFFFLEIICFILIVNFNKEQNEIYLHSASIFSSRITEEYNELSDFIHLKAISDSLAQENAQLKQEILRISNKDLNHVDTLYSADTMPRFVFYPAKIISKTINKRNNYFTINKGISHGLEPGMGIINSEGILGYIVKCTNHHSLVLSILHSQAKLSAAIKRKNYHGSLTWQSASPKLMQLESIPKHADIAIGDTVQSSGYSLIFPEEILIGVIDTFTLSRGSNFFEIDVTLFTDLSKAKYVYAVQNLLKEEQQSFNKIADDE